MSVPIRVWLGFKMRSARVASSTKIGQGIYPPGTLQGFCCWAAVADSPAATLILMAGLLMGTLEGPPGKAEDPGCPLSAAF